MKTIGKNVVNQSRENGVTEGRTAIYRTLPQIQRPNKPF